MTRLCRPSQEKGMGFDIVIATPLFDSVAMVILSTDTSPREAFPCCAPDTTRLATLGGLTASGMHHESCCQYEFCVRPGGESPQSTSVSASSSHVVTLSPNDASRLLIDFLESASHLNSRKAQWLSLYLEIMFDNAILQNSMDSYYALGSCFPPREESPMSSA